MKQLLYGTLTINYEIIRAKRSKLGIIINQGGHITVKAPKEASEEQIAKRVKKRAPWIFKQQTLLNATRENTAVLPYISGGAHWYLGKEYILHVKESKKTSVNFKEHLFHVELSNMNNYTSPEQRQQYVEQLINDWYKERAKIKFAEFAEPILLHFKKYNVEPSAIYVQKMEKKWAISTPNGKIILNIDLIKTPRQCIEYVIRHELCHFVYKRHTSLFFNLLTSEMPDWKEWKKKLEEILFCET
ncbi:MAG: M48 family metallopeptidase [Bacteroidales bacterium]|jgi:predicted metal-dependent hydrolase|nr:M48 family metallopeptidase [Bacteroidales bacterium]